MDAAQISALLTGILGTGGIGTVLTLLLARKSRKAGVPSDEAAAKVAATTPDWSALNDYWKHEITSVRRNAAKEIADLKAEHSVYRVHAEAREAADEAFIDKLERHIWLGLGAPPPERSALPSPGPAPQPDPGVSESDHEDAAP